MDANKDKEDGAGASALLPEDAVANELGVSARTLQSWRVIGGGPRFIKVGRSVRYRRRDLDAYLEARTVGSTSEVAA